MLLVYKENSTHLHQNKYNSFLFESKRKPREKEGKKAEEDVKKRW